MKIFWKREIQEIHISFFKAKYGVLECLNCQVLLKLGASLAAGLGSRAVIS